MSTILYIAERYMAAAKGNSYGKGNKGGGRPSEYKPSYNKLAYHMALLGATDEELAGAFDVSGQTINNWKEKHEGFSLALKKGKIIADANVAASLYKRAIGFEYDEVTFEKIDSKVNLEATSEGEIKLDESYKKKIVTKLIAPDVAAINIWLKNRRGKVSDGSQRWADKQEQGFTDQNGNDLPINSLPTEAISQLEKILSIAHDSRTAKEGQ